jgi:hypothetical protein
MSYFLLVLGLVTFLALSLSLPHGARRQQRDAEEAQITAEIEAIKVNIIHNTSSFSILSNESRSLFVVGKYQQSFR